MMLDAPVSQIMTEKVVTVTPDQKLVDVKHIYEKTPFHHHIPVIEKNKLVGVISLVDFMRVVGNATLDENEDVYQKLAVKDIMSKNPLTIKPSTPIKKVSKDMTKGDVHAFLVSERGQLKGIVSYVDIIKYLLRVLD